MIFLFLREENASSKEIKTLKMFVLTACVMTNSEFRSNLKVASTTLCICKVSNHELKVQKCSDSDAEVDKTH